MKYLCLIYLDEEQMDALPAEEMNALNAGHLDLNDDLRRSGHFIAAEALYGSREAVTLRLREGKKIVRDGPFTEAKELVAGFYFIEARDMDEAIDIAARFPSSPLSHVEIRQCRELIVPGRG